MLRICRTSCSLSAGEAPQNEYACFAVAFIYACALQIAVCQFLLFLYIGLLFDGRTQMLRICCLSLKSNCSPMQTPHMLLAYLSMFGIEHMQSLLVPILLYITLPSDVRTQMLRIRCSVAGSLLATLMNWRCCRTQILRICCLSG